MGIKLGIVLNSQFVVGDDPVERTEELLEQVRTARDVGLDSIWIIQHFLAEPYQMLQQMPFIGRVTADAGEMTVGTGIFQLTLSNPVYAAEQAATLDVLTGGRFVFGIGLGFRDEEFLAFDVNPKKRVSRFEECLETAIRLWTEETVDHHGQHFTLEQARLLLKPVQKPYPPVWIAGSGDPAVKRAGRYGMPWLINPHATIGTVERQMGLFNESLDEHGQAAPDVVPLFRELAVGTTRDDAVKISRAALEKKYGAYANWGLDKPMPEDETLSAPFDELAADRFIIGSPQECVDELGRYNERIGANHFLLRVHWPGMKQADVLRQLETLGGDVLPHLDG